MSSSLLRSSLLRGTISSSSLSSTSTLYFPFCHQSLRLKHTVRIILVDDLPTGKAYRGDVIHVAAGYMRNYLFPKKIALYATPQNFERLGRKDPDSETAEERRQRLERMASDELNEDLKAANLLTKYLNGKMLKIYRKVDDAGGVHPGVVTAQNIRDKLSKQLMIDLDVSEQVHILPDPLLEDFSPEQITAMMEAFPIDTPCEVQLKKLGFFFAKLSLAGGYSVPLKFQVIKKVY